MNDSTSRAEDFIGHPLASELAGRKLRARTDVTLSFEGSEMALVRAPGLIEHSDKFVSVTPRGDVATFTASVAISGASAQSTGLAARIRLRGWRKLRYLAFGYNNDGQFVHVKFINPPEDEWFSVTVDRTGIDFKLANGWDRPLSDRVSEARLFISCDEPCEGAIIDIAHITTWEEDCADGRSAEIVENQELMNILDRFLSGKWPAASQQCETLMLGESFLILPNRSLRWPANEPVPPAVGENATFRYIWHSLQIFALLAMRGMRLGERTMVEFALREAMGWIERSYRNVDPDRKMTWYDHGTAERLISLVVIRIASNAYLDARTARSLEEAIDAHARLLRSEAFYAANQPTRFHNHSIFQDIALLVAAAASRSPAAPHWAKLATQRLHAQFDALIVRDGDYSAFAENSIGYHQGVALLVERAEEVEAVANVAQQSRSDAAAMNRFSDLMRSHYGRPPAVGDSYRLPNPEAGSTPRLPQRLPSGATVLREAGYAILRGSDAGDFFHLTMIGSSKSPTHKHADHLSLSLIFGGIEWLVDPSFYSHEYSAPVPAYLRGPWAHNMVVVDNVECLITPGTTRLGLLSDPDTHGFTGTSEAFPGSTIRRKVRGRLNTLDFVIDDSVSGDKDASYLNLHFGDGVEVHVHGHDLFLTHPATHRNLRISLPETPTLLNGWHTGAKDSSVVATGFETIIDSVTARVPLDTGHARWTIRASEG